MTSRNFNLRVRSRNGDPARRAGKHGRDDSPIGQQAEEFLAAWIAAIGWETKIPFDDIEDARPDPFPCDMLEVEISATRAVDVVHEGNRDRPGIKPQVACLASPGPQTHQRGEEVGDSATA
jgi:hypothetical protein